MCTNQEQILDMAKLAGAEQITAPQLASDGQRTEAPAATHDGKHFILGLEGDPQVKIRASRQRMFTNGLEASYNFPWLLSEVEPPAGKTPEQLGAGAEAVGLVLLGRRASVGAASVEAAGLVGAGELCAEPGALPKCAALGT
jgi:hypothetical protein